MPGCDWSGSRSGRSKHTRRVHGRPEAPAAENSAENSPTAASRPAPDQSQPGSGHRDIIDVLVHTQSGSYEGSLPLINSSGRPTTSRNIESTRIIDQSETLNSSDSASHVTYNSDNDPAWEPY